MNDSSQESDATPARIDPNNSSREDERCLEGQQSSSTRLSSPSPTRSSGSPDSGYSTIELEPGSRALSLARLAVRVRDGEGEEVVAALHLLARLLDGTWGEEEAKVSLMRLHPFIITICTICMSTRLSTRWAPRSPPSLLSLTEPRRPK